MGLYLCVFEGENELEGVEVGTYSDFDFFRGTVTQLLESGVAGRTYPVLILHSDSNGEWSATDCVSLERELTDISAKAKQLPAVPYQTDWQQKLADLLSWKPKTLYETFIDVDGELLIERLLGLCKVALERQLPILFQ